MNDQILKVETDPIDRNCLQITLRHRPAKYEFWRSKQPLVAKYKGHGHHWYQVPSFKPAPSRLIPLLKAISYGPQYKHLRFRMRAMRQ